MSLLSRLLPKSIYHTKTWSMLYLGRSIKVETQSEQYGHQYLGDYDCVSEQDKRILYIDNPNTNKKVFQKTVEQAAEDWLKQRALHWFTKRAVVFSDRSQLTPSKIALSSARRRWGSCSSKKVIRLNWRLIHLEPSLIDYVIVHEFGHLKEMNHSKAFWAEVARIMPNYKAYDQQLKHINIDRLFNPIF